MIMKFTTALRQTVLIIVPIMRVSPYFKSISHENIKKVECLEYPELGMEAIWKIEVEDFPAFILVDDKGNDFFQQIKQNVIC